MTAAASIRFSEHFTDSGAVMLAHACEMGLEGIVSKQLNAPYRSGRSESVRQDQVLERAGIGGRRLCAVERAAERDRRAGGGRLRRRRTALCRARRHRLYAGGRARSVEAAPSARNRQAAVRRHSARRAPRGALGQAHDGDRSESRRLDRGRPGAAGGIQGRARGQAGARSGARGAGDGGKDQIEKQARPDRAKQRRSLRRRPADQIDEVPPPKSGASDEQREQDRRRTTIRRKARCTSPIPIGSIGPTSASPSRTLPITIAPPGTGWRRTW